MITPNQTFYRIDTAFLGVPRVDIQEWALSIEGRVDSPYSISYFDLLDMPMVEKDVTLSCVSNEVGGDLVGNARWLGVPLAEVLDRAGVNDDAEQLVGRSVDDFTVGFPVEAVYDGRDALLAVGMNGEPLPMEHGFPARLVVAGPLRLRLGDQMALVDRADRMGRVRCLLDSPGLGQGGTDQDAEPDRYSDSGCVGGAGDATGCRCGLGAASGHLQSRGEIGRGGRVGGSSARRALV